MGNHGIMNTFNLFISSCMNASISIRVLLKHATFEFDYESLQLVHKLMHECKHIQDLLIHASPIKTQPYSSIISNYNK